MVSAAPRGNVVTMIGKEPAGSTGTTHWNRAMFVDCEINSSEALRPPIVAKVSVQSAVVCDTGLVTVNVRESPAKPASESKAT